MSLWLLRSFVHANCIRRLQGMPEEGRAGARSRAARGGVSRYAAETQRMTSVPSTEENRSGMSLAAFQGQIERIYYEKDSQRGMSGTFMWFVEEVGELSRALRRGTPEEITGEFADVLAWLATLASIAGVDLQTAAGKYAAGCPKCGQTPCHCSEPSTG